MNICFYLSCARDFSSSCRKPADVRVQQQYSPDSGHCLCVLSGPNRGHYITIVKSHGFWLLFDDDIVEVRHLQVCSVFLASCVCAVSKQHLPCVVQKIDAQAIEEFYGLTSDISKNSESGYILFYQSRE